MAPETHLDLLFLPPGIYTSPTFFIRISSGVMPSGREVATPHWLSLLHSKPSGWFRSIQFCSHWTGRIAGGTHRQASSRGLVFVE